MPGLDKAIPGSFHTDETDLKVLAGDITSRDDVDRLYEEFDVVIRTAAVVREGGDPALFQKVNVLLVRRRLEQPDDIVDHSRPDL